ncbi:MAG: carboxypeptidase regulatory-like domain-containing protein [Bryobacteraceae bacterium]
MLSRQAKAAAIESRGSRCLPASKCLNFFALLICFNSLAVFAQERIGSISGRVTDATGAEIPDASVEVSGAPLVRPITTRSDSEGAFHFPSLPPGAYTVAVTREGFVSFKRSGLVVAVGRTASLTARLEVGQITESIVISGFASTVDTSSNVITTNVASDLYDRLPKGRSFDTLVALAPGVRFEPKSGGYQIDGASSSENAYLLDSLELTDIRKGNLDRKSRVPVEWIAETQIKSSGVDAQFPGSIGGVIHAITRSGGNGFHGQASLYGEADRFDAGPRPTLLLSAYDDNQAISLRPREDSRRFLNPGFLLGGPIRKDTLWFLISSYPQFERLERSVQFLSPEIVQSYRRDNRQDFTIARMDWAPDRQTRFSGSYFYDPYRVRGLLPSRLGTDSADSPWADQGFRSPMTGFTYQADHSFNSLFAVSAFGGYHYLNYKDYGVPAGTYYRNAVSPSTLPPDLVSQVPQPFLRPAGDLTPNSHQTIADKFSRLNANLTASYLTHSHNLRFGWQFTRMSNYANAEAWAGGMVTAYWDLAYSAITKGGTFRGPFGYYRYRFFGSTGDVSSTAHALFLQDTWRVGRHVTLNLGLRAERESVPSFSAPEVAPAKAIEFGFPRKLAPRLGIVVDPSGKGHSRLLASWGLYHDAMKYDLPRASFGGDKFQDFFYTLDDPDLFKIRPAPTVQDLRNGSFTGTLIESVDRRLTANNPANNLIDQDLRPVRLQAWDAGYDRNLSHQYLLGLRYTHKQLDRTIEDVGVLTPQGERYYITNPGFGLSVDPRRFPAGFPPTPKAVRRYDALEARLERRFSRGLFFMSSFTWSRLYGNYSGLASSDEAKNSEDGGAGGESFTQTYGRRSPNINRYFDEGWMNYDSRGNLVYGRLATDRPYTFKFLGSYDYRSRLGTTRIGPQFFLFSGTPLTTEFNVQDVPVFVNGRGDLGRTPLFSQTDLLLSHDFPVGEGRRIRLEVNATNLFNQAAVLDVWKTQSHANDGALTFSDLTATFKPYDYLGLARSRVDVAGRPAPLRTDPRYGLPVTYQLPRVVRLGIHFYF